MNIPSTPSSFDLSKAKKELLDAVKKHLMDKNPENEIDIIIWQITKALAIAEKSHAEEERDDKTKYISHPIAVAIIGMEIFPDTIPEDTLVQILHDVIESNPESYQEIVV
jgi:(p)ppGpp synthase/HD superfamily hydrolase